MQKSGWMADTLALALTEETQGKGKGEAEAGRWCSRKGQNEEIALEKPRKNSAAQDEVTERSMSTRMGPALGVSHTSLWEDREQGRDARALDSDQADKI